jgi:Ca2+-binding EF-hand superfamily protein
MGDIDDINTFFQAADLDRNGYIDKEKLQRICPHLTLAEIDTIFHDLGKGHDNRIYLKELIQSPELDKQNVSDYECNKEERMTQKQINEIFNTLTWYE